MSQPTAYYPAYNFTQYQTSHPTTPLPAASVDSELFSISTSITEICTNLALIQRDDGALANQSVGFNQLQSGLTIGLAAPATNWATGKAYTVNATVYQSNSIYICAISHTSGTFATDLAAGDWILLINTGQYVTAASASATAAAASATSAAAAVGNMQATSATSVTIGSGAQTFTTQSGKFFTAGAFVTITSNANPTVNFMNAQITSYSGTTLVVNVQALGGSGAHTDWTISVSGSVGATGPQGSAGAGTGDMLKANNLSELANFATARTNLGLGSAALQANSFFNQTANNLSDVANAATAFSNIKQTGTSAATGVLQLATNAQAITGTDTALAVTCAGVAAAIAAHAGAINTYQNQNLTPTSVGISSVFKMSGLAGSITPGTSSTVLLVITGSVRPVSNTYSMVIKYGTGAAPASNAAVTGTSVGSTMTAIASVSTITMPFTLIGVATGLSLGTAYWIDIAGCSNDGSVDGLANVGITAVEIH